jgi:superfamily I DNA/RNA helicase
MGVEEALSSMRAGAVPDAAVPRQERLAALRERIHSLRARIPRNPLPDLLRDLFGDVPEEGEAADAVRLLGGLAEAHGSDVAGFLNEVGLLTDADLYRPDAEAVTLMTMHAAKGLEFPVVFVTGCEAGWIPFEDGARAGDPAEERRLFYVAVTRARERLFLTWARRRRIRGITVDRAPSPFLFDIDAALRQHPATESGPRRNPGQRQMQLF